MGVELFSEEDKTKLYQSKQLTPAEEDSLDSGLNITLGLVIKAKRILELITIRDQSTLASKTEVNLLINEIDKAMVKLFLIFKLLEKKGLVTEQELFDLTVELEGVNKEKKDAESQGNAGGRKRSISRSKKKSAYASDRSNIIVRPVSTHRKSKRSSKAAK